MGMNVWNNCGMGKLYKKTWVLLSSWGKILCAQVGYLFLVVRAN